MPYQLVLNTSSLDRGTKIALIRELATLRAELDDLRTKYAAVLAKLDLDAGVTDTNYGATGALATATFTAT